MSEELLLHMEKNNQINEKYPANIWTFAQVNLYNDYFIACAPKVDGSQIDGVEDGNISKKIEVSPERRIFNFHHQEFLGFNQNLISLSNRERSKIKDKSIIIGSRYRFYIPLFDKNKNSSWVIYADPTILFLNNPRTLIENLDPSKTVYVCKHDNYATKRLTKTLIPSIKYPFSKYFKDFFTELMYRLPEDKDPTIVEPIKELFAPENFEKYNKLFAQKNLSQDDFMKACLAIFKDKKNYMIRNKSIASEQVLEEIYQKWYVNDEMESFDNYDYDKKNWSSFMIFNKEKFKLKWQQLDNYSIEDLHQFEWCDDKEIGEIPPSWNHLVDEQEDISNPNALNFTIDSPGRYNSTSTSKLNQKYININIAQCMCAAFETLALEDGSENVIDVDKNFDLFAKFISDLTPKKLKDYYDKLSIEQYSPLETLYMKNDSEKEFDYNNMLARNLINIQFYFQNYNDSQNKLSDMIKILQEQIKNLTQSDKNEILKVYRGYINFYKDDDEVEHRRDQPNDMVIDNQQCYSIRELTGRMI